MHKTDKGLLLLLAILCTALGWYFATPNRDNIVMPESGYRGGLGVRGM